MIVVMDAKLSAERAARDLYGPGEPGLYAQAQTQMRSAKRIIEQAHEAALVEDRMRSAAKEDGRE